MQELSRVTLYSELMNRQDIQYGRVARFNYLMLFGLEELFVTDDLDNQRGRKVISIDAVIEILHRNISGVRREFFNHDNRDNNEDTQELNDGKMSHTIEKVEKELESTLSKKKRTVSPYNVFNKVINALAKYNENEVKVELFQQKLQENISYNQVFLSHAYDDRLYSAALFEYFLKHNIYLYIDWMHNNVFKDGRDLKGLLQKEIKKSEQLLFLRTVNSETNIQGKQIVRPWCSWEMGNFYSTIGNNEKYLLNLYSVDDYNNTQLHGLKLFQGVNSGRLFGRIIVPK